MIGRKLVVDTDLILDHLAGGESPSPLRRIMRSYFCYTTAFNAIEAFSVARSEREIRAVESAMGAMKILGLNSKSAKAYGRLFARRSWGNGNAIPLLVAGACIESGLPIATMNPKRFSGIKGLRIVPWKMLAAGLV